MGHVWAVSSSKSENFEDHWHVQTFTIQWPHLGASMHQFALHSFYKFTLFHMKITHKIISFPPLHDQVSSPKFSVIVSTFITSSLKWIIVFWEAIYIAKYHLKETILWFLIEPRLNPRFCLFFSPFLALLHCIYMLLIIHSLTILMLSFQSYSFNLECGAITWYNPLMFNPMRC